MSRIDLLKVATAGPNDLGSLKLLAESGYSADDIMAVVSKTEGNGVVNDFSRTLADVTWADVVNDDAITVFSGGTEGVLSPHVNLIVRAEHEPEAGLPGAVVAATGSTRSIGAHELGRAPQTEAVRSRVESLVTDLGLALGDVHLVLVKCPLLTSADIAACKAAGQTPVTSDTIASMGRSRAASALGIALALGECTPEQATAALAGDAAEVYSSVASASSGAELDNCKIMVLGSSPEARGTLRAAHGVMRDAIDAETISALLRQVRGERGEVVQVFAKAGPDPSGKVRGRRHTMLTDSDISATRHARAAVGGLVAGLVGDCAVYVSGGAEHQGPPGGGSLTVLYRVAG
ncbi:MAG TPA: ring-opening amidohydrolase [Jatrophihabitans sp.]|jgi:cyanuric acid amidohydrolase